MTNKFDKNMESDLKLLKEIFKRETNCHILYPGAPKYRDSKDIFQIDDKEYVLVSKPVNHSYAFHYCKTKLNGRLAHIPNEKVADFIAEALSETILINSSVWIAAKTKDSTSTELYWFDENNMLEPLSEDLKRLIDNRIISDRKGRYIWNENEEALIKELHKMILIPCRFRKASKGDCLSIDRIYLDIPRLFPDRCSVLKPILCERQGTTKIYLKSGKESSVKNKTHVISISENNIY
ncbi:hypothetical protein ILUMI_13563 [Ignelater luminosus]|uniref:Uncharacterized protein n=1 Tax=Ignelater luminosus TaxID=2038154 RepID=A0A8K0CYA9_IGNLU|nr:hypothetical protein ILUMI_13563 [Ignelater luminosus]